MPPKANQVVLYRAKPTRKPKPRGMKKAVRTVQFVTMPKRKKKTGPRKMPSMAQAMRQYQIAIRNPFSPDALGVRVVDGVCYPTTVSHLRFKASVTTSATGTFQAVILPFLHAGMIVQAGSVTGMPNVYPVNTQIGYAISAGTLATFYTQCRVSSWGCRVILTDSNQNAKGTYTVAPVMLGGYVPGETVCTQGAASTTTILKAFGVPSPTETIASMPSAVAVNAQDLMTRGELVMRGLPYGPDAYNMKSVNNQGISWAANQMFFPNSGLWNAATGAVTSIEQNTLNEANGQIGYLISVANAPADTQEFILEFIYHLEGIPLPTSGLVNTASPSPAGSTNTVERILSTLTSAGDYFAMGTSVAQGVAALGTKMYQFRQSTRMLL